jgi:hypothetical protein
MKKTLLRFWPILFILGVWFIFASPYFLKGKVPYSSTYQVNFFPPWSAYEKFWGPVKNNAMPDIHGQIYPWKKFTVETLKKWQIPLWNPYSFSGNPHLANFQSAVLSPFNILFFILPFIDAWSLLVLLQPLLAGLFMYLFVRVLKISCPGSFLAAVSFMFCGFMVVWMAYGTLGFAILYLPLALLAIEKYHLTKKLVFLILLTITVPLSFFSGHLQISLYFLLVVVFYILFKGMTTKNLSASCCLFLATSLGIIISLPQLFPSFNLYLRSVRSELFLLTETIPLRYLITIISPDFFGNPVTRNDWFGHYAEWAGFIGIWPLFLAIFAVAKNPKKTLVFFLMGIVSLILAVNSPLSSFLVSLKIPVFSTSALSRIIVIFSFSFAVLAGFGFDELLNILKTQEYKKLIICLLLFLFFIIAVWGVLFFLKPLPSPWLIVAKRNFILPTMPFLGGAFLIFLSLRFKRFTLFAICYLLFAISFDSFRFAQKWMPFDKKELVYPLVPIITAIKQNIGTARIFGNLGNEVASYYGFPTIEGYDPLYIGRYGEFIRSTDGKLVKGERSVVHLDRNSKMTDRVLDLLGVGLIFHPVADTNQGWAYSVWQKKDRYELIYQDDKFALYKNKLALPRAVLFYDFKLIKDDNQILTTFYDPNFDFKKILILEKDPGIKLMAGGKGEAEIVSFSPNEIIIKVKTNNPALLFLSDNYYPAWRAEIDGVQTEILRADYTFKVVPVPEGESTVNFFMRWF